MVELETSDLLSPNMYALVTIRTHRYLSVFLRSMTCSVAVLAATNSEPYVAVSTVACLFENQSVGVVLTKCSTAVTDFLVTMSWSRLASKNVVVITLFLMAWVYPLGFLHKHFCRQSRWSIHILVWVCENNQVLWFYT